MDHKDHQGSRFSELRETAGGVPLPVGGGGTGSRQKKTSQAAMAPDAARAHYTF